MTLALVSTDWVAAHVDDPTVKLIEVDWDGLDAYRTSHIPGAIGWNWKDALWDPFERQFPSDEEFCRRLGESGIGNNTTVVFYGVPVQFGTYAWWVFKYFGHDDVRLLDGGRVKWESDGRPLTRDVPVHSSAQYRNPDRNQTIRAGRDDVMGEIANLRAPFSIIARTRSIPGHASVSPASRTRALSATDAYRVRCTSHSMRFSTTMRHSNPQTNSDKS